MIDLGQQLLGTTFQNPIILASGTCGYGQELDGLFDIDSVGALAIKAVTLEPRTGNPPPRVSEFAGGMLNSIGLANVGVDRVLSEKLPWLAGRLQHARVIVNVAGRTAEEYGELVRRLEASSAFVAYELNVSCPNVKEGGAIFCSREDLLAGAVGAARAATSRPLIVKLAPNIPDIGRMAEVAVAAGADALTLVNTMPGLLYDLRTRRPVLGAGSGGVSGAGLLPVGVHAVRQARRRVQVPIVGAGGVRSGGDVVQYLLAGASLVELGTVLFADPRAPGRVLNGLRRYIRQARMQHWTELIGAGLEP